MIDQAALSRYHRDGFIVVEEVFSAAEIEAMRTALDRAARRDLYGEDDAAALRDILFAWWEARFLTAANGAPSMETDAV